MAAEYLLLSQNMIKMLQLISINEDKLLLEMKKITLNKWKERQK